MKNICVINFWEGAFDGDFFDFFFRSCFGDINYISDLYTADLIVTSVFGNTQTDPNKTLAYIGENVRPSFVGYSRSLSFDYDTYGGRNLRLPIWYARLAWPGFIQKPRKPNFHNHGYEDLISIDSLTRGRTLDINQKTKFCAMVAGNPEGLRVNLFNSISEYRRVDGYGNMFNRPLRKSKFDLLKDYKFSLCPENSIYDGYVTEKLIDAYAGGTVPIYSGDASVAEDFNYMAFLNYQEFRDMSRFTEYVRGWDTNPEMYKHTYQHPLLTKEPSLDDAIAFVRSIVK